MSESEDAARYRWLRSQFALHSEGNERDEFVESKGNRRIYEVRRDWWHYYTLTDEWRFGAHTDSQIAPRFDELVDKAMKESTG